MCLARDAGYAVAGQTWGELHTYVQLWKVSEGGDLLWSRACAEGDYVMGHCVHATPDGGYLVAGQVGISTWQSAYLLRTDACRAKRPYRSGWRTTRRACSTSTTSPAA